MAQKLILGTAQFGSDYGIKHDGQPSEREIERIARIAWDGGIRTVHTSWQYNCPDICSAIFDEFEVINKDPENADLFWWNGEKGLAAYNVEDGQGKNWKMLQFPVNVLDHRFVGKNYYCKTIARSVFLQGLILMEPIDWPDWFVDNDQAFNKLLKFHQVCKHKLKIQPYEGALGYVLGLDEIDHVIVGVNSAKQLEQLLQVKPLKWDYDFSITDENILDPRKWPA